METKLLSEFYHLEEFRGIDAKPDLEKMRESVSRFREFSDIIKEDNKIRAGIIKAKYDALISEGFTPAQALELCKVPY